MGDSSESSFGAPPVSPRSPPGSLDFYGKRTQMVKVQALEREIGLLQDELKSVDGFQPASAYCKEVDDFVGATQDPLVIITPKIHESHSLCKHLCCERSCICPSVCCCFRCTTRLKMPSFFGCCKSCKSCFHCSCLNNTSCMKCCNCEGHSCSNCASCCCWPFFPKCIKVNSCCGCRKACYNCCCQ